MAIPCHLLVKIITMVFGFVLFIFVPVYKIIWRDSKTMPFLFPRIPSNLTLDPTCLSCTKHVSPSSRPHQSNDNTIHHLAQTWNLVATHDAMPCILTSNTASVKTYCLSSSNNGTILPMENICDDFWLPGHTILTTGEYPILCIHLPE